MVDVKIEFTENGENRTKKDMSQYCPYLPEKEVFETISGHKLHPAGLGYDFINQLYLNLDGETISETNSRIWKASGDSWKIVKMDIVRYQVVE